MGVSSKDDDKDRYDSIDQGYFKDNNVTIVPPKETAFSPVKDDGIEISASDIRNHISDKEMLRSYLPVYVEDDTFNKIYDILNGKSKDRLDSEEETRLGSQIFQNLLEDEKTLNESIEEEQAQQQCIDEEDTEFSGIRMDDSSLDNAKCSIIAYNTNGKDCIYNPKSNPDKAIDILFEMDDGNNVEVFLNPNTKEWDSRVNGSVKLTPDQMGEFFGTDLCRMIDGRIQQIWPESDPYFRELLEAVRQKKINLDPCGMMTEDGEFRKGNIDINRSRGKNAAGEQIYTNSGRKIISFSDFGVKHDDQEAYFVWPEHGKEFKWSQWKDWKKIHPLLRMRFTHLSYTYGLSMSPLIKDDENRGFRSYNLDLEPKLQYCTPIETREMMDLTIVQKFLRNAYKRLKRFVDMSDQEIFDRIGRPDKLELGDVRKTKHVVRNSLNAIKDGRADTYIYT